MRSFKYAAVFFAGLAAAATAHAAPVTVNGTNNLSAQVTATNATGATTSPFLLGNFGASPYSTTPVSINQVQLANSGTISFTPNASTPQAGVYSGSTPNIVLAPTTGTNLSAGNFLAAQPNDPVTIKFGVTQTSFSLLWGSVDQYNSLNLDLMKNGNSIGTVTVSGSNVGASIGGSINYGVTPAFVTIDNLLKNQSLVSFDTLILTSTSSAFEFIPSVQVPEPVSLAVLGMGLAALGLVRRRGSSQA